MNPNEETPGSEPTPVKEEATTPVAPALGDNEILLSDKRVAQILKGKGKHAQDAMELSEGKSKLYMSSLMGLLVTIDNKKIVPEDLAELDMKDYNSILAKFTE